MTATRTWPFPDLRNGTTFHHISDTHFGALSHVDFVQKWLDGVATDLETLAVPSNRGHVHTGDMIEWFAPYNDNAARVTEYAWYRAWRDGIKAIDGSLPWAEAVGNHDMLGPVDGAGNRAGRPASQWCSDVGIPSQNMVHDMGEVRVITVGPDWWFRDVAAGEQVNSYILPDATLDWLDAQLSATSKPCFIACHIVLQEQFTDVTEDAYNAANVANPRLNDILSSHPNAVGWLSGHKHSWIGKSQAFTVMTLPSGKRMYAINAPGSGGGTRAGVPEADHQWQSHNYSVFLTYFGDRLDVRWRDHNARIWTTASMSRMKQLLL